MVDLLINTLTAGTGLPVYRQGSLAPEGDWDKSFYTFWNDDTPDDAQYDNRSHACTHEYTLCIYSTDPSLTYSMLDKAREVLEPVGFEFGSRGYDVASGRSTYTGRGVDVNYKEVLTHG